MILEYIEQFLWGNAMLLAFFLIGLFYTVWTNFFQFVHIRLWLSKTIGSFTKRRKTESEKQSLSPFQAMSAALAGSMGIGNIVGVAAALTAGGPGAIFWMWVSALLGAMTKYAEIVLGFHYRYRDQQGNWVGGPMVYLKEGLKSPFLSGCFSVICIIGSFAMGNMTQGNSMAEILNYTFDIPVLVTGFVAAALIAFVIIGGVERIGKLSAVLIPFMSVFYIIACLLVIGANITKVPAAIWSIFVYAFRPKPILGGIGGYYLKTALRTGVMRGVFSNEAGIGSSVIAHAASSAKEGVEQGMWGIFEVLLDTVVVCTLTALVILTSGVYDVQIYRAVKIPGAVTLPDGATLATDAFSSVLGGFGQHFLTFATVVFAFATIIAWSHYGEQCVVYLLGKRYLYLYKILYVCSVLLGCVMRMDVVWRIADNMNALMAIPNLIALTFLGKVVLTDTRNYLEKIEE
ncbi:MAG: sodium:alanine symporter family protein [Lachnospiraceae bacterium]|nr:sodium:alanine symporter family protein [Lachnospiraceae bacterium]